MRAVQLTGFGGPERLVRRDDPSDPQAGPDEGFVGTLVVVPNGEVTR